MSHSEPTGRRNEVFESAVDVWLVLVLAAAPLLSIGSGLFALWDGKGEAAAILFGSAAFVILVVVVFVVPCRYTLLEDVISIRCGMIVRQVAYDQITDVRKSGTLVSGPALSLRRVLIVTPAGNHVVSPKDRDRFIASVRAAMPVPSPDRT